MMDTNCISYVYFQVLPTHRTETIAYAETNDCSSFMSYYKLHFYTML
jgi:hypothetical protein